MNRKRFFVMLFAMLLSVIFVFAGCNGGGQSGGQQGEEGEQGGQSGGQQGEEGEQGGNQGEQDPPEEEESEIMKNLKAQAILKNQEKVVTEPTFEIDRTVPDKASAFRLPIQFNDFMLMQANAVVSIFGEYDNDGGIAVEIVDDESKGERTYTFYGEVKDGAFEIYISPMPYGNDYTVTLYTPTGKLSFEDCAFGELYLMSGQSNMGMTMSQCLDPTMPEPSELIYENYVSGYNNEYIHTMQIWPSMGDNEVDSLNGSGGRAWSFATSRTVADMSAFGFFFCKRMFELYRIPVGMVQSSMGGTSTCCWIPAQEYERADDHYAGTGESNKPSARYNTMIHPLRKTVFRGVCWYQGEGQDVKYFENTSLLIEGWRRAFDQDLAFHIVELPRYIAGNYEIWDSVREQQRRLSEELENVSFSVNVDRGIFAKDVTKGHYNPGILGDDGIHCPDKEPVGERAAEAFAKKFYLAPGTLTSPELRSAEVTADGVLLAYDVGESSLVLKNKMCGFEVSADGNTWTYATPSAVGTDKVLLKADVENIRYVRYACSYRCVEVFGGDGTPDEIENLVCLYNKEGYPADQFLIELTEGKWTGK